MALVSIQAVYGLMFVQLLLILMGNTSNMASRAASYAPAQVLFYVSVAPPHGVETAVVLTTLMTVFFFYAPNWLGKMMTAMR